MTTLNLQEIIQRLRDPALYPATDGVRVEQTHASAVFIAGDDVYKLKKPVDFGFLDYSTPERRHEMCRLEVELNRRMATDVYLGVVPLTLEEGRLRIGGEGRTIDYLVHMRRLPESASLRARAIEDHVETGDIDAVARRIAEFHTGAATGPEIDRRGTPEAVAGNIEENFEQIEPYVGLTLPATTFETIASAARTFLNDERALLERRVAAGMIRDGHGDIRSDHVYLLDGVQIIDCIEFNERLRYGDVVADIGFLAMDLDALNRPDLADRLIATYAGYTGWEVASVLDFYRSYRAVVRGKVTSFRLDEPDIEEEVRRAIMREARRFFHLAHRYSAGDRGPRLIIMSGVTGTGKSTLARQLADILPAGLIDSDTTRKRLAGLAPTSRQEPAFDTGIYGREMSERVYRELLDRAAPLLDKGRTVILDATYIRQADRLAARDLARRYDAQFTLIHCTAPEDLVRERLAARGRDPERVSDGRWEIYQGQIATAEPVAGFTAAEVIGIDTARPIIVQLEDAISRVEIAGCKSTA